MHVQAPQIHDIAERAHAAGKPVVLGGPSVSASPEMYPDIDYLHIGEMGDATDRIIALIDESVARPAAPMLFETKERLPLQDFPIPAYNLIPLKNYLMLTLQFSSGCPYLCEFCDIPNLYGRQPRLKTAAQIIAELDAMRRQKGIRRWSISSMTISSATARPPRTCCRTWSRGRSSTAIPCSSPARRRSTSPSSRRSWR